MERALGEAEPAAERPCLTNPAARRPGRQFPREFYEPPEELIASLGIVPNPLQHGWRHALDHLEEQVVVGFHGASVPRFAPGRRREYLAVSPRN
jgi:hypothetical protein